MCVIICDRVFADITNQQGRENAKLQFASFLADMNQNQLLKTKPQYSISFYNNYTEKNLKRLKGC